MKTSLKASSVNISKQVDVFTVGVLLTLLATCSLYFFTSLYEDVIYSDTTENSNVLSNSTASGSYWNTNNINTQKSPTNVLINHASSGYITDNISSTTSVQSMLITKEDLLAFITAHKEYLLTMPERQNLTNNRAGLEHRKNHNKPINFQTLIPAVHNMDCISTEHSGRKHLNDIAQLSWSDCHKQSQQKKTIL